MCLYGRIEERQHMSTIRRRFRQSRIVNPADYQGHPFKRVDSVGFCLKLVEGCDLVVYSRLFNKITAGVGKEINHALKVGKQVFELKGGRLVRRIRQAKYISRQATVRLYRRYRGY
jgi:hypothetical protein